MPTPRQPSPAERARGASSNPANRFEALHVELDPVEDDQEEPRAPLRTRFYRDHSQSIIARNNSPDVGFDASINPYRGCEHGCAYCYARPTHEFLGMSAGLDFESKIMVKTDAAELLRRELSKKSWKPQVIAISGVTDCYQPVERKLEITRSCLEVLAEFRNPVGIITKNHLVTRDIDVLRALAEHQAVMVNLSITTLDGELAKILEPRASSPARRLAAVQELHTAGIPVGIFMAPIIPGLNDHEIPRVLAAAAEAGACDAGFVPLRLPLAVAPLFEAWLERHRPGEKDKILGRVRAMRGGRLNDSEFGSRMRGEGFYAEQIKGLFNVAKLRVGFRGFPHELSTASFRVPSNQLRLSIGD